jgi:hypothetical protein
MHWSATAVISPKTYGEGAFFIGFRNGKIMALFPSFTTRVI